MPKGSLVRVCFRSKERTENSRKRMRGTQRKKERQYALYTALHKHETRKVAWKSERKAVKKAACWDKNSADEEIAKKIIRIKDVERKLRRDKRIG